MSSIPGIDSRAPERTDTSSGSSGSPSDLPARSSRRRERVRDLLLEAGGLLAAGRHVGDARLGGDREARRHALGAEHPRHLGDVRALAAEQVAHLARALGEVVDELRLPRARAESLGLGLGRHPPHPHVGVVLERLRDRAVGLAEGAAPARSGARPAGGPARRRGTRGPPRRAGTSPPRSPGRPRRPRWPRSRSGARRSPQVAHDASSGAKPAASSSLIRNASACARVAASGSRSSSWSSWQSRL